MQIPVITNNEVYDDTLNDAHLYKDKLFLNIIMYIFNTAFIAFRIFKLKNVHFKPY